MEIGSGVFLSAIFLGTVWLYVATKDRWNWKKILLWPLAIVLGLSVIGAAGIYINDWVQDRPKKELGFWGIQLGASIADVKFTKGEPSRVKDVDIWQYPHGTPEREDGVFVVIFKDGKVRFVFHISNKNSSNPSIQGISSYSNTEDLVERFGQPSHVSRSKDELLQWHSFERFNVAFMLERGQVIALGVYDSSTGPIKFSDEAEAEREKAPMNKTEEFEFRLRLEQERGQAP